MKTSLRRMASALLVLPVATSAAPFIQSRIEVVYGPMADVALLSQLKQGHIGENIRSHLLDFAPKASLTLKLADCGQVNAFYAARSGAHQIHLCSELFQHLIGQGKDRNEAAIQHAHRVAGGAALWIAGHELGHYLLHRHQLPFLGREEDIADQVGTAVLLRSRWPSDGVAGVIQYFSRGVEEQDPGDVHSLDATRRVNLACLVLGTGQPAYDSLRSLVPAGRQPGCRIEFEKFRRGIQGLQRAIN